MVKRVSKSADLKVSLPRRKSSTLLIGFIYYTNRTCLSKYFNIELLAETKEEPVVELGMSMFLRLVISLMKILRYLSRSCLFDLQICN